MPGGTHNRTWGLALRRFARLPSRVLAFAGAIALGAIGAVALAAPASAHTAQLSYELKCGPEAGTATVVWTIKNNWHTDGTVKLNRDLNGVKDGDTVGANKSSIGTEDVQLADHAKTLKLTMKWPDRVKDDHDVTADWSQLNCAQRPKVEFTDKCDKSVVVKVTNTSNETIKIAVNGKEPFVERSDIPAGKSWEVTVPGAYTEHVRVKFPGGDQIADHNWTAPEVCYTVSHKSDCDKLSITVKNDGTQPLTASVKVGDKEEKTDIPAGQSDTATFKAAEGLVVTLTVGGKSTEVKYEKPADCAPALPVTGVNAGLLAGAALVLVSGGTGLYFVARRRRIRFAA
jgi:hypothetical protein